MDYQINQKSREHEVSTQRPVPSTNDQQCAICLNDLERDRIISALGQNWHSDCFRCSVCDVQLSHWYFEKDGLLFCRDDYLQRFNNACQQCSSFISGPAMIVGEHKFHPECFCCGSCQQYIGDGDSYALVERSKLFCGNCYHQQIDPRAKNLPRKSIESPTSLSDILAPSSSAQSIQKTLPHSIRLVEIPWTSENKNVIRLSIDDSSSIQSGTPTPTNNKCSGIRISQRICRMYGRFGKYLFTIVTSTLNKCCNDSNGINNVIIDCDRFDSNTDSASVQIGDQVLEVNGTPVTGKSIENIDELIQSNNMDVLQLTIEHDPHRLRKSMSEVTIITEQPTPISPLPKCRNVCCNRSPSIREPPTIKIERTYVKQFSQNDASDMDSIVYPEITLAATSKVQQLCKNKTSPLNCAIGTNNLKNQKERCSSMSKLLDENHPPTTDGYDLSRTKSFRVDTQESTQRIFRASDLVIGELLGKGFFGQVFKVTHKLTKEVMVLKELYRVDEEAQRNFLKEVAVLRSLSHGNVLRFIGVLYRDKKLHLVTEFVPGGSLKELIQNIDLVLPWECRIRFAKDIACGMAYLHSKNIIHRDLNSLNCLVREDKTVIVADFGLARIIKSGNSKSSNRLTVDGNGTVNRKYRQRRQRYTVVGNPYWMAPEMMKMMRYDEKVDIFSFGIVLCEIIGRVQADPDFLPRTSDFGLNKTVFKEKFCAECPELFYEITFLCCDLNPDARPSFEILDVWLERLARRIATGRMRSFDLRQEIESWFKGTTTTNTIPSTKRTDIILSARSPSPLNRKSDFKINEFSSADYYMDTTDSKIHSESNSTNDISKTTSNGISKAISSSIKINDINHTNRCISPNEIKTQIQSVPSTPEKNHNNNIQRIKNGCIDSMDSASLSFREINEIPKSPHLSKDFSPNGERLRSSIRFRRQARMQKQRSLRSMANRLSQPISWDIGGENTNTSNENETIERIPNYFNSSKMPFSYSNDVMPEERRKSKPYGEKGFIIQMNDGALTLNDVKDLNNCYSDDFDSSCDTSLNYIDPDSIHTTIELDAIPMIIPNNLLKSPIKTISFDTTLRRIDEPIKYSLDGVRENLNKCKSKLDALEIVETKIGKKKSIKPKSKVPKVSLNDVFAQHSDKQRQSSTVCYARLHPLSSPALNSRSFISKKSPDSPPKAITQKSLDPSMKSNGNKNYYKNTQSYNEKINDSLNDRHLRLPPTNGKLDERKPTKKPNISSCSRSDQSIEMVTTKPPAPNSHKKRSDGNKSSTIRNNDNSNNINGKQKKINSNLHSAPTHKRL